jgi:aspartokinase-like uncharacterized kinase
MGESDPATGPIVVKVGGSLYDLPDLGPRLRDWLTGLGSWPVLLVPGGGATADVVRELDGRHGLGEEAAHWLALRALSLNAHFLQGLLPGAVVVGWPHELPPAERPCVLDAFAFVEEDEGRPGCLPHTWEVTSDAVAARVAVVARARRLVLLKSAMVPQGVAWAEAGRRGLVDAWFARVLEQAPGLEVCAVNLRESRPS